MNPVHIIVLVSLCTSFLFVEARSKHVSKISSITVIGSVYCDACSNNFSKHSYFLQGAKVLVECEFKVNSVSKEEISIKAYQTTDKFGVYKLEIPSVDGFDCKQGREIQSMCRASLIKSSSFGCNVTGMRSSTEHVAVKSNKENICYFNLNALSYRPARKNSLLCGTGKEAVSDPWSSSQFFWPLLPPFGIPWQDLPFPLSAIPFLIPPSLQFPFPHIPFPDPSSLPFPIPSWILPFLKPPFFPFSFPPFPFLTPTPSSPSIPLKFPASNPLAPAQVLSSEP